MYLFQKSDVYSLKGFLLRRKLRRVQRHRDKRTNSQVSSEEMVIDSYSDLYPPSRL